MDSQSKFAVGAGALVCVAVGYALGRQSIPVAPKSTDSGNATHTKVAEAKAASADMPRKQRKLQTQFEEEGEADDEEDWTRTPLFSDATPEQKFAPESLMSKSKEPPRAIATATNEEEEQSKRPMLTKQSTRMLRVEAPKAGVVVSVGSANPIKLAAVTTCLKKYAATALALVVNANVQSGVSPQPLTLEETARGARQRATAAYRAVQGCAFGIGIESGMFKMSKDGPWFDMCVVSVYDGTGHHLGHSCGFEVPKKIAAHVQKSGLALTDACVAAGITNDNDLGSKDGLIGILSSGKITRQEYTIQAVMCALCFLEHPTWFS